ncbi:MAG: hypothetical protein R3Y09_10160 [Clostridia bacterium]
MLEKIEYIVKDIVGDYGILIDSKGNENPVAMFFLPDGISVGSRIAYENLEYEIIK